MTKALLHYIDKRLSDAGINYELAEWTAEISYPYWVGDYNENGAENEDGMFECDFTLDGFSRGKWITLENDREIIESIFSDCTTILDNGSGIDVSYSGSMIVPTGDAELKRMQIKLKIKEWKVIT